MTSGQFGTFSIWIGLIASLLAMIAYIVAAARPNADGSLRKIGRGLYTVTAFSILSAFLTLGMMVFNRKYQYDYVVQHTGNNVTNLWFRFAAAWSGQEGSFLLWAAWTAIIGFLVFARAGKYEARVMPFFTSVLAFLCAILLKQTPFLLFRAVTANADWTTIPPDGRGLTPSLQNYWMTIHPPTIFFGFASLAVPYAYAMAALIWKDYKGWTSRVMPYALLTCATLGLGLFMGGYWAYETLGWHGFWAWDPVENASFFPWLAITALVHGLVVQKSREGMARTNTFLGILAFWLFLLGTFLTRSGVLAENSVHAFDNISKSGLILMEAMLILYGVAGVVMWIVRVGSMPVRKTLGESAVSRDFAFFVSILLMLIACMVVTFGTTSPLFMTWMHKRPVAPEAHFYNQILLPLALIFAFVLGSVPWLAWRKTDPEKFLRKLIIPWFVMLAFGFFMIFWVQQATAGLQQSMEPSDYQSTLHYWFGPAMQRVLVVSLASLGLLAALSNAMLAYRVFRAKPLNAGGWLAHVGMGVLIIGVVVSNTFERTIRVSIVEGEPAKDVFGYKIGFEGMTGKAPAFRPTDPSYDLKNAVKLRITPPGAETDNSDGPKTFVMEPRWFVHNMLTAAPWKHQRMRWPSIEKYMGHDLYVGLASDAQYEWPLGDTYSSTMAYTLKPKDWIDVGGYRIGYFEPFGEPQKIIGAKVVIVGPDKHPVVTEPAVRMLQNPEFNPNMEMDETNQPMYMIPVNEDIPELKDADGNIGAIEAIKRDPATQKFTFRVSLPNYRGRWNVPLEITFKPWVNLVWIGVLIAVAGTLLAMVRRLLEARKPDNDTPPTTGDPLVVEPWDMPPATDPPASGASMPIIDVQPRPTPQFKGKPKTV